MKRSVITVWALAFFVITAGWAQTTGKRPMTFMDIMEMRALRSRAVSPDGKWLLYSVAIPNWSKGELFTDIFLSPLQGGAARQLTFTKDKNEDNPHWAKDGTFFAFTSDREGKRQIYFMRWDGGEARRMTDHKDGVGAAIEWSKNGDYLAYTAGKDEDQQLWLLPKGAEKPVRLTKHETPVKGFWWSPNGRHIYFTAPDALDRESRRRIEKKFDVKIANQADPPIHLWVIDVETKAESRLTSGNEFTIRSGMFGGQGDPMMGTLVVISKDGRKIAFRGSSPDRYATGEEAEVYLLDVASNKLTRVTDNRVSEGQMSFSPDSRWLAFTAPDEFTYMRNTRIYVTAVDGGPVKKLGNEFDNNISFGFWSPDSKTIYFNDQVGTTTNLYRLTTATNRVEPVTREQGLVMTSRDEDTDVMLVSYSDPYSPADLYATTLDGIESRARWTRVTRINPQVERFALGTTESIRWKSSDGVMVEGVLVKPVNYEPGRRYPLIVQLHGGPAGASTLGFSGSYSTYTGIYAANGYMVLQPNYRGSTGYGEKFRMQIAGDYFRQAYDDIIRGVDYLIEKGFVDPSALGMMGWSAGGHWANWTLVTTDRFKAISTGAGAVNWISMYAQTDVQVPREFYFKGKPYENWDHYLDVSPLKYIKRAKTPTLIHVGEADPRVPKPQSDELHMALKKLQVPTEYIVYPGMPHGLTKPRYQMVKMAAEFNWFEKWIKGKPGWLDWKTLLDTLKDDDEKEPRKEEEVKTEGDATP